MDKERTVWPWVVGAVLVLGVATIVQTVSVQSPQVEPEVVAGKTPFLLPGQKLAASSFMRKDRAVVHGVLGSPLESGPRSELGPAFDSYRIGGIELTVTYDEEDRAKFLSVSHREAGQHMAEVRQWLDLPPRDRILFGGVPYRFFAFNPEALWLESEKDGEARARARAKLEAEAAREAQREGIQARKRVAFNVQEALLASGLEAAVSAHGATLRIDTPWCSRVFLRQLLMGDETKVMGTYRAMAFRESLLEAGFTTLSCADPSSGVIWTNLQ